MVKQQNHQRQHLVMHAAHACTVRFKFIYTYMISSFLEVDVVLEDMITLGKELKIVTMDKFK